MYRLSSGRSTRLDAASCTQRKFVFDLSEYELRHLEATFASSCKEFTSRPEEQTMDLEGGFSTNDIWICILFSLVEAEDL